MTTEWTDEITRALRVITTAHGDHLPTGALFAGPALCFLPPPRPDVDDEEAPRLAGHEATPSSPQPSSGPPGPRGRM
jgi:hypothetical protein